MGTVPTKEDVDRRSERLIAEFMEHFQECCFRSQMAPDQRVVFEGWTIQKIASLQLLVEHLWSERYG